ncbi:MAG: class I SAM-dependent methyltransferase [Planctomycetes bacterium]|nr:class I SAM-dependent methyltransferase [Planctomycetota bacterium]
MIPKSRLSKHRSLLTPFRRNWARRLSGRILECGGGIGDYLPYLKGDVTVLDLNLHVLTLLDHPKKIVATCEAMPFADNTFDCIWACAVIQYVHLDTFLREASRVTRPGGRVLVLVPNGKSPWDVFKRWLGMDTWQSQEGIVRQYTVDDLRRYGTVEGEIRFLPLEHLFRRLPRLGHTLMLHMKVAK